MSLWFFACCIVRRILQIFPVPYFGLSKLIYTQSRFNLANSHFPGYRWILFHTCNAFFRLINICLSLSDEANKIKFSIYWRSIPVSVIAENLSPINWIILEKNPKIDKECMSSWRVCHPTIWQYLMAAISFELN